MSQPAKIFLSQLSDGRLCVYSGGIYGDRMQPADPRLNFRQRLAGMTAKDKAECCRLSRKLGAVELTAQFERMAKWTS
jgi:hypothetical protein